MVRSLVSEDGARQIEAAIQRIEARSATELVVAVVPRSSDYWRFRLLVAAGWGVAAVLGLHFALPELDSVRLLLAEPVLAAAVYGLFGWAPLLRLLMAPSEATQAVELRAFALFSARGLHRTRARTGLLILVSELEHRVVMLGDSGIHERVGEGGWSEHVAHLIGRIREGKTTEGVLEVLARLEPTLAELAPPRADDLNELPNRVIRD